MSLETRFECPRFIFDYSQRDSIKECWVVLSCKETSTHLQDRNSPTKTSSLGRSIPAVADVVWSNIVVGEVYSAQLLSVPW